MEILAPVGGAEQLRAAVYCGADAVYLGGKGFNARRNAENFGRLDLAEAVNFCHGRGVKVYVTVNTLITDRERDALTEELRGIAAAGADAIIVQDLAVARLARTCCPSLPLHASTQMILHDTDGAELARELGFRRIVPARELTLEEIRALAATGLEIECFVHGALCMCVSGGCYLSAMLGGRSGNRGLCAQPCRLDFTAPGGRAYALSLKDMSYVQHIHALEEAGVCSLKIEGRMKRPEYVAAAVTACRDAVQGRKPDLATLEAVFSRSGFTDGYLTGKRDLSMFGIRRREDVQASAAVLGRLAELYRNEGQHVPVDMTLTLREGRPAELTVRDGTYAVSVAGEPPQRARTRPTDPETARKNLGRTGGTPFRLEALELTAEPELTAPPSQLNDLRRRGLEQLLALRSAPRPHPFQTPEAWTPPERVPPEPPELRLRFRRAEQLFEGCEALPVSLPAAELDRYPELLARLERVAAELPPVCFPTDAPALEAQLLRLKDLGLRHLICGSLGALGLARRLGFEAHGGHGLNIMNTGALEEYGRLGLQDATLSFELNMRDAARLGGALPRGLLAYGRLPLMTFRNCPARTEKGCGGCGGTPVLRDRKGVEFPLACWERRCVSLLNSVPLDIAGRQTAPVDFLTLYFTLEDAETCARVLEDCRLGRSVQGPRTGGLYYRELL